MAMPQALRDARGYRSRYINALNAAIKAIAPIAGKGIRLRQTPQGLPPRGRGRVYMSNTAHQREGITPAWAGKRPRGAGRGWEPEDYPRVGGEESKLVSLAYFRPGLPPRGRGRGSRWHQRSRPVRIPRVGGEEGVLARATFRSLGLPPRGRGRDLAEAALAEEHGITPAWAGKSGSLWRLASGI